MRGTWRVWVGAVVQVVAVVVAAAEPPVRTLVIDLHSDRGTVAPRVGFLGGLRDELPDELIAPLRPRLWRIGHQFRGRIAQGLPGAIDRVERLGARYKLVISDLVQSRNDGWDEARWRQYDEDLRRLVVSLGDRAKGIIWEPVNEPDISHKPIERYQALYARAFRVLREIDPELAICGPGFAFPTFEKNRAFLDFCRHEGIEVNYFAWHYTGWDPHAPISQRWNLEGLPDLVAEYPELKIREIHCDEWGAGPDRPGRLHPGRAVVWFDYLENVYRVDRACRANWGREDDYLGGIVTREGRPHPVYHVYRLYGQTVGQTRLATEGTDRHLGCLASRSDDQAEVLVGYIGEEPIALRLDLVGLAKDKSAIAIRRIPESNFDAVLELPELPAETAFRAEAIAGGLRITLPSVRENQAYHVMLAP